MFQTKRIKKVRQLLDELQSDLDEAARKAEERFQSGTVQDYVITQATFETLSAVVARLKKVLE